MALLRSPVRSRLAPPSSSSCRIKEIKVHAIAGCELLFELYCDLAYLYPLGYNAQHVCFDPIIRF